MNNLSLTCFYLLPYAWHVVGKIQRPGLTARICQADDRHWRFFYLFIRNLMAILLWVAVCGRAHALPEPDSRSVNLHTRRPPSAHEGAEIYKPQ
jgi:hypothetical protein